MVKKVSEMTKMIEKDGWILHNQKGSHRQFKHSIKSGKVTINGKPSDDLGHFLVKSIKDQAGIK